MIFDQIPIDIKGLPTLSNSMNGGLRDGTPPEVMRKLKYDKFKNKLPKVFTAVKFIEAYGKTPSAGRQLLKHLIKDRVIIEHSKAVPESSIVAKYKKVEK